MADGTAVQSGNVELQLDRRTCDGKFEPVYQQAEHDREWYEQNDPQSLQDSINTANAANPARG